ncbi:MAG: phosphoglycerate kinase [bacterium]|nr:phosphoglycerate kinase [bacterium]
MNEVSDMEVRGKRVFVRSSLNVALNEEGKIADDFRIRMSAPTIRELSEGGARVVVAGHLGRPEGRDEKLSLKALVPRLEELLGQDVSFVSDCVGAEAEKAVSEMSDGDVMLLENLRFHKGEVENDPVFAQQLERLADLYVNDAFDVAHRAHASVFQLPKLLLSSMGPQFAEELKVLDRILQHPDRPFVAVVGGSKVESKARFAVKLAEKADVVLVANLVRDAMPEIPSNVLAASDGVRVGERELDIGPETTARFIEEIRKARTVFWSGPLGMAEEEAYQAGSLAVAKAILEIPRFSVIGGGDITAFLGLMGLREKFTHVSTGGGAMLAYVAGEKLPGIIALEHSYHG